MRFTAIDTSAWEELKKSIEELALCVREHFGTKPEFPDLLHNGDVCRILNISKRTLQHYRETSVLDSFATCLIDTADKPSLRTILDTPLNISFSISFAVLLLAISFIFNAEGQGILLTLLFSLSI